MTTKTNNHDETMIEEQFAQEEMAKAQLEQQDDLVAAETSKTTEEKNDKKSTKRKKRIRIRLIPIWLRLVIIAILLVVSVLFGVVVGYAVIGDGNFSDAFNKSTWTHIVDFVTKK